MMERSALEVLQGIYDEMNKMTDRELFDHLYSSSESFRELVRRSTPALGVQEKIASNSQSKSTVVINVSVVKNIVKLDDDYSINKDCLWTTHACLIKLVKTTEKEIWKV